MASSGVNVDRTGIYGLSAILGAMGMYYLLATNVDWLVSLAFLICGVLLAIAGMFQDKNDLF